MVSACLVTSLLLAGCSTGQSNDNKGSSNLSDDKSQSSKSDKNSKIIIQIMHQVKVLMTRVKRTLIRRIRIQILIMRKYG